MRVLSGNPERLSWPYLLLCVEEAKKSKCKRSRCGSVIVDKEGMVIGYGFNSKPCDEGGECFKDNLPAGFKSDKTCCVHAEQRAIADALNRNSAHIKGSRLYFVRIDENNNVLKSGKPYCTICSKAALDAGIAEFVLYHKEGVTVYNTKEYNELSFQYSEPVKPVTGKRYNYKFIESEEQYQSYLKRLGEIWPTDPHIGNFDNDEEFIILCFYIEQYEKQNYPIQKPKPIEVIKLKLEESGLSKKAFAESIGTSERTLGRILNKERELTVPIIRNISKTYKVPAELLID